MKKTFQAKELALAAFIDIEGAFDNASHLSITSAMEELQIEQGIIGWIRRMLSNRLVTAELGGTSYTIKTTRGCPQGGVLSPLLWCIVVDRLLKNLQSLGYEVIGFADDVVIIVRGKFDKIIWDRMQSAFNYTLSWCDREGLNINPSKTVIIPFTRRRIVIEGNLYLNGTLLKNSHQVKYLGVILDKKLNWNAHLDHVLNRATDGFWACNRTFGKKWGLNPKMIYWIYKAIIRPRITYASLIWWPKTNEVSAKKKLEKLQGLVLRSIAGAMRSTPTIALDALFNILPLHQWIQLEAKREALKLNRDNSLLEGNLVGHLSILNVTSLGLRSRMIEDWMESKRNYEVPYQVFEHTRNVWENGGPAIPAGSIAFYTDGSRTETSSGAGVYGPRCNIAIAMGKWPTVFQSEIQAIIECLLVCLKRTIAILKFVSFQTVKPP